MVGAGSGLGRGGLIGAIARQGPLLTTRYPSARAMQLFENVRKSPPLRAQTGAYSLVQIAGPAGGVGRGGPGLGGGTASTTQDASIKPLKISIAQRPRFIR